MSGRGTVKAIVSSSNAPGCTTPTGSPQGLTEMDVTTLFNMSLKQRLL